MPPMHPYVLMKDGDQEVEIDEEMAPIIRFLWEAGVTTISSCQEMGDDNAPSEARCPHITARHERYRGYSNIAFPATQAGRFYDLIVDGDPSDELFERMTNAVAEHAWETLVWMLPRGPGRNGRMYMPWSITFTFPSSDRPEIVACLERAAAKRAGSSVGAGL